MLSAVTWASPRKAIEDFHQRARAAFGLALEMSGYAEGTDGVFRQRWVQDLDWLTRIHELSFEWREVQQDMSGALVQRLAPPNPPSVLLRTSTTTETRPRVIETGVSIGVGRGGNVGPIIRPRVIGNMTEEEYIADKNRPGKASGYPVGAPAYTHRNPATGDIWVIPRRIRILPSPALSSVGTYQHETTTVDLHEVRNFAHLSAGEGDDLIVVGAVWSADHPAMGLQFDMLAVDAGAGDDVVRPLWYANYYPALLYGPVSAQVAVPQASFPGGVLFGNEGNDTLHGGTHDDRLIGGRGDDLLIGGLGNDEYVFFHGDGSDTVLEHGAVAAGTYAWNEIVLPVGVRPVDLVVAVSSVEMLATYEDRPELVDPRLELPFGHKARSAFAAADLSWGTADRVRVILPHREHSAGSGVNAIRFSDGTVLPFAHVLRGLSPAQTHPQDLGNHLVAADIGETLAGLGGDDTLQGGDGADDLIGGPGRDALLGGPGHDRLYGARLGVLRMEDRADVLVSEFSDEGNLYRGGPGHDTLWLTSGADIVEVGAGDGEDVLETLSHARFTYGGFTAPGTLAPSALERAALLGNRDTLRFGPGISPEAVRVDRVPALSNGVFHGGWRSDLLLSYQGPWNSLRVVNWFDADLRKGDAADPGGPVFPHQLQRVEFADGTVWSFEEILDRVGRAAPRFQGNRPPRPLPGREVTLASGQLFDLDLDGLIFEDPDPGDELILAAETRDGQPLPDWMWIDGHERRLHGVAPVTLPGGLSLTLVALDKGQIQVEGALQVWVGERNRAPEALESSLLAPATEAMAWRLDLGAGGFRDADAGDVLTLGLDPATPLGAWLQFDAVVGVLHGTPGPEHVGESVLTILATDLAGETARMQVIVPVAAAPGRHLVGDASDNRLAGTGSADTLVGAGGHDVLEGFGGDDEYRWSPGDGLDRIVETGGSDVLVFGPGVTARDVVLRRTDASSATVWSLRLRDASGGEVRGQGLDIAAAPNGGMPIKTLRFGDGVVVDARVLPSAPQSSTVTARGVPFVGGEGDDDIRVAVEEAVVFSGAGNDRVRALGGSLVARGGPGDDLLSGGAGDDILHGDGGVDVVSGGAGRDLLHADGEPDLLLGGLGADVLRAGAGPAGHILVGGAGADTLHLGAGAHLLAWNPGDGMDTVRADRDVRVVWSIGGADPSEFGVRRDGASLVLERAGGEGMRLEAWYDAARMRPEVKLQFVPAVTSGDPSGLPQRVGMLDLAETLARREGAEAPRETLSPLLPAGVSTAALRPVASAVGGDLSWAYASGGMAGLEGASLHRVVQLLAFPGITGQPQPMNGDGWLRDGAEVLARL
jgi:Ca2+-binding RTX toxin-like protein